MKNPILKIKNKEVEIRRHPENPELFHLNDLHKASGLTGQLDDLVRHLSEKAIRRFDVLQKKGGKNQGTWANKKGAYWFAAKVDEDFEDAVFECFDAASKGNAIGAVNAAASVVITPEMIAKAEHWSKELDRLVPTCTTFYNLNHAYPNIRNLVIKVVSGYTKSQLTGNRSLSAMTYIIQKEHPEALGAYTATLEMVARMLRAGVTDYHKIAATLDVQTNKNKHLMV